MWLFLLLESLIKTYKEKEHFIDNHGHNVLRLFDKIETVFLLPQVKGSVIICNKHGIHKIRQKLLNNVRLRISRN